MASRVWEGEALGRCWQLQRWVGPDGGRGDWRMAEVEAWEWREWLGRLGLAQLEGLRWVELEEWGCVVFES